MSGLTPRARVTAIAADGTGEEWRLRWLEATNRERSRAGLPAYREHPALVEAAKLRVEDMLAEHYFGHTDPANDPARIDGKYDEVVRQLGATTWLWLGENLAQNRGFADPLAEALRGLMASPTHRANILFEGFDTMGSWAGLRDDSMYVFAFVFAGGLA